MNDYNDSILRMTEAGNVDERKLLLDQARAADPKRFDAAMRRLMRAIYPPWWRRLGIFVLQGLTALALIYATVLLLRWALSVEP